MRTRAAVGALAFAGYFLVARGVGNVYPFSTFSMYSATKLATASRVVAKDATGAVHEVTAYERYRCDAPFDLSPSRCDAAYSIDYVDQETLEDLREHVGDPRNPERIEIVRRIWRFPSDGSAPTTDDCVLHRCEADRR